MTSVTRVATRALVLAGAAAAIALLARGALFRAVTPAIEAGAIGLADGARALPTPGKTIELPLRAPVVAELTLGSPELSSTTPSDAPKPAPRLARLPRAGAQPAKPEKPKAAPTPVLTRAEVEAAIANRVGGARTKLVRDDDGEIVGLAVFGAAPLARFGVVDGDILVSANGYSLRTPSDALAALGALRDATRVTVVFRRGDARYALTAEIGQ